MGCVFLASAFYVPIGTYITQALLTAVTSLYVVPYKSRQPVFLYIHLGQKQQYKILYCNHKSLNTCAHLRDLTHSHDCARSIEINYDMIHQTWSDCAPADRAFCARSASMSHLFKGFFLLCVKKTFKKNMLYWQAVGGQRGLLAIINFYRPRSRLRKCAEALTPFPHSISLWVYIWTVFILNCENESCITNRWNSIAAAKMSTRHFLTIYGSKTGECIIISYYKFICSYVYQ